MSYTSYSLKKEYRDKTNIQRSKNLKRIREDIAKLSLSDLAKKTGITKNDLSMIENGDKLLSLFHILAYKKFFFENYKMNLSVDFIMGFTDILENVNLNYQNETGLSNNAIETLRTLKISHVNLLDVVNVLLAKQDKIIPLLSNIRIIISNDIWNPCLTVYSNDNSEYTLCKMIDSSYNLGFCNSDITSNNYGVWEIDESILKSHAIIKIQEILNSYKENNKE